MGCWGKAEWEQQYSQIPRGHSGEKQNSGSRRTVALDDQRGSIHTWETGMYWNKNRTAELGYVDSSGAAVAAAAVVVASAACSGFGANTGT